MSPSRVGSSAVCEGADTKQWCCCMEQVIFRDTQMI